MYSTQHLHGCHQYHPCQHRRVKGNVDCKSIVWTRRSHAHRRGTVQFSHRWYPPQTLNDTISLSRSGMEILPIKLWKLLISHCILFKVNNQI